MSCKSFRGEPTLLEPLSEFLSAEQWQRIFAARFDTAARNNSSAEAAACSVGKSFAARTERWKNL